MDSAAGREWLPGLEMVGMHIQSCIFLRSGWREVGEDRAGAPSSLPHSECFFYDSLEIVMKGRPGEKQLFAQNSVRTPGVCCWDSGF